MKTPETPRSYLPKLADPPAPEERDGKKVPRYVEIPALREHGFGPRNLFWGVATLVLALLFLVAALFFAGPKATLSLATALVTFTALFVLSRMHVFRQRNGGFLAIAVVCLLGTLIPLVEAGFEGLKHVEFHSAPGAASASVNGEPQVLTQAFALSAPEGSGKRIKVLKDSRVTIADRSYLIKAGDLFPYIESHGDEATFAVRDLRLSLPTKVVEVIDPSAVAQGVTGASPELPAVAQKAPVTDAPDTPPAPLTSEQLAAITMSAQKEAIRRYPALGIKDSMENHLFVATYQQIREKDAAFFTNPEWPIELAEYLASQRGWVRGNGPAVAGATTNGPAPVLDAPRVSDGTEPAAPSNLPPVDQLDAGAGLPSAADR